MTLASGSPRVGGSPRMCGSPRAGGSPRRHPPNSTEFKSRVANFGNIIFRGTILKRFPGAGRTFGRLMVYLAILLFFTVIFVAFVRVRPDEYTSAENVVASVISSKGEKIVGNGISSSRPRSNLTKGKQEKKHHGTKDGRMKKIKVNEKEEIRVEHNSGHHSHKKAAKDFLKCNIYSGKWVLDVRNRPIYSGKNCKWLAPSWSCRLGKNSTFEYETYRWKPHDCDPPRYTGQHFLERMRNRTISFVGDSLGLQQFQSLLCTIDNNKKKPLRVENASSNFGFVIPPGKRSPNGWAYTFVDYNVTLAYGNTVTLCKIEQLGFEPSTAAQNSNSSGRLVTPASFQSYGAKMHIDLVDPVLKVLAQKSDVLILNTGHHWNSNKKRLNNWTLYYNNAPMNFYDAKGVKRKDDMSLGKAISLNKTMSWVDREMSARKKKYGKIPLVMMTTISPRHFTNGEWNTGGRCDFLRMGQNSTLRKVVDMASQLATAGTKIKLLNITNLSEFRGEAHVAGWDFFNKTKKMDCLHWCLPGVPDTWNELMFWEVLRLDESAR